MSTYTQEPDADLTAWIAEIDEQSALDVALAKAMADYRAQAVADNDEEVEILPGEDTICVVCEHPLPAGATAYADNDGVLCVDCAAVELEAAGRKG